jgi:membrane-bound metal-dependent hydrolase YbcI (DUF457 family)
MFAINHAATALIVKKNFPTAKLFWLLLSVQLVEFLWVIFNLIGLEKSSTDPVVTYIGNIHLYHMPFSHSILSSVILALLSFLVINYFFKDTTLAFAFSVGVLSHIVLDLLTHSKDIPLTFLFANPKFGTQIYPLLPYFAFAFEFAYGLFCWFYYKGSKPLLITIVLFNSLNFTIFSPDMVGLEKYFANQPVLLTLVILFQILITLYLVGRYSKEPERSGFLSILASKG